MRDMLPDDMERFRRIESAFRNACLGWGYREVRTPTIERLHLFTAAGTLSPQMLDRVYSFLDWDGWSGERVVLRPDSTIPVARLYTERLKDARVAKLFYVQSVLRFSEGDDSREDWQCGAELIGDTYPLGDIELVLIACEVLQGLGLTPEIKLSDPGILRAVFSKAGLTNSEQLTLYDRVLEGDVSALDEVQARLAFSSASLGNLLTIEGEGTPYLSNLQTTLSKTVPEASKAIEELAAVSDALGRIGVAHLISPVLVRNFEYYTGPVFHLYSGGRHVGGGGRYDGLLSLVGGEAVPASGFALDMAVLIDLLGSSTVSAGLLVTVKPSSSSAEDLASAFAVARALRESGATVCIAPTAEGATSEVIASETEFTLKANGAQPYTLSRVDEVVRAIAKLPSD
jgi:histidyl-tRNA synthetase